MASRKLRSPESITDNSPAPAEGSSDNASSPADFERALAELEAIVDKLEGGDLSLDESLKYFERGVQLTRQCQTALKQAEQKVEILMRKSDGEFTTAPFESSNDQDD